MEQLTQSLKDGKMELLEVPFPALSPGCVLVRTHYSAISTGTEGKTVKDARLGYIGKARARKQEVKKVVESAKTHGVMKTYRMVMNKLEAPSSLGYSCCGEVIAVADDVVGIQVGDLVACAGSSAAHAEVVAVPINLCVKVNQLEVMPHAAYVAIGAIALQGVRQAELSIGANAVVIGLGFIGQLTLQLLRASGVRTMGIDIDEKQVALARKAGFDEVYTRDTAGLEDILLKATDGYGTDAVIITAGTSSHDPVDFAGVIARKKGKVVIVGAVPTGFQRKQYYRKELDLRMSSSYGPGRYDANYEEQGIDYPIGYVRWTENRNMSTFISLLENKSIDLETITTHTYPFDKAPDAYGMIVDRSEHFSGILLKYDSKKEVSRSIALKAPTAQAAPGIGFIGAGSFAQNFLLPVLKDSASLVSVATARANTARNVADKFGFASCTCEASEVWSNPNVKAVFIATRHNLHAPYAIETLKQGKSVFVEKPLCIEEDHLDEIAAAVEQSEGQLQVGFNRRFAPQVVQMMSQLPPDLPRAIQYRVNAGIVPADHWAHDPQVGGGRILGEVCHFIDLARFIAGSPISTVQAAALGDNPLLDSVSVLLTFANGSTASINYFSNGSKKLEKEFLEVFCGRQVWQIEDFKRMKVYGGGAQKSKLSGQDKGHAAGVKAFMDAVEKGVPLPIPFTEVLEVTKATFHVLRSIRNGGESVTL